MKDPVVSRRKNINLFFTIVAILLICYTIGQLVYDYMQEQNAVEVEAKIETIDANPIGYSAHVTYKVEGVEYDQYHVDLGLNNKLTVGDYTKIKYNIKNPKKLIKNNHIILVTITGSIGILLLILFLPKRIKIMKKDSNIKNLMKDGIKINANIQDIIINQNSQKNKGFFPYKLRANYLNPTDNKTYIFESEDTYINPNDIIAKYQTKTVIVYLDKNNTSNYYVDIQSLIPKTVVVNPLEYMKQKKEEEQAKLAKENTEVQPESETSADKEQNEKENSNP